MNPILQKLFPQWFPVEKRMSGYNTLEVIRQKGKFVLNAPHVNYSFGSLHEVFQSTFRQLSTDFSQMKSVLILGFGAGSVAHILQKENGCPCSITGVEIDEEVIALAKKYFGLDELQRLDLHVSGAAGYLSKETKAFDLIVADLFLDHRTPEKFLQAAFLKTLYGHLLPGGTVLFNYLCYDYEARKKAAAFEINFRKTFHQVRPLTFKKHPRNIVFTGRKPCRKLNDF